MKYSELTDIRLIEACNESGHPDEFGVCTLVVAKYGGSWHEALFDIRQPATIPSDAEAITWQKRPGRPPSVSGQGESRYIPRELLPIVDGILSGDEAAASVGDYSVIRVLDTCPICGDVEKFEASSTIKNKQFSVSYDCGNCGFAGGAG